MRAERDETDGETGTAAAQLNRPDSFKRRSKKKLLPERIRGPWTMQCVSLYFVSRQN